MGGALYFELYGNIVTTKFEETVSSTGFPIWWGTEESNFNRFIFQIKM